MPPYRRIIGLGHIAALVWLMASCSRGQGGVGTGTGPNATSGAEASSASAGGSFVGQVPEGPGWPGWVEPELDAIAVDFRGTCVWGRSAGEARRYRVPLQVKPSQANPGLGQTSPGSEMMRAIPVRTNARFVADDASNIIGELPAGTRMLGDGPLHGGYGMGYAVPVRGHTGRICRGYIEAAAVITTAAAPTEKSKP